MFPLVVWCSLVPPLPAMVVSSMVEEDARSGSAARSSRTRR